MKKLLFLLLAAFLFSSCEKETINYVYMDSTKKESYTLTKKPIYNGQSSSGSQSSSVLCGAMTKKGAPCKNRRNSCPHH
jgi:hypothetical protein